MAREIVEVSVSAQGYNGFDEEKRKSLDAHDGDCLPLVKEKFPLQSKVGLLSVVTRCSSSRRSGWGAKAISKLDANVLNGVLPRMGVRCYSLCCQQVSKRRLVISWRFCWCETEGNECWRFQGPSVETS
jgi:hypothetical protein